MNNRCKRCNRELSDPNADYGWRCAQILGVSNQLSKMRPEAFERFLSGISKADKLMGNADFNSEQKNGMYKSYAKMALWDGIDKNKVAEAKKDSFAAAGGRKSNTNLAEELSVWDKLGELKKGIEERGVLGEISKRLDDKGKLDDYVNYYMKTNDTGIIDKLTHPLDTLRHLTYGAINRAVNETVDLSGYNGDYINDQNSGKVGKLRYGLWDMKHNGCEIIAVYNALKTLGEKPNIKNIANHFENNGQVLYGFFGTTPYVNERYFKAKGYKTKVVEGKENIMQHKIPKADAYILTVVNGTNIADGLHTISFKRKEDGTGYDFFNYESSEENEKQESASLNAMLRTYNDVPLVLLCISK